jgi:hypothetical protein
MKKYTVRTPDGELTFSDVQALQRAYVEGLVAPEDEVREEGTDVWRRADSLPRLAGAPKPSRSPVPHLGGLVFLVAFGVAGLYLLIRGPGARERGIGFLLAFILSAYLIQFTNRVFQRRKSR